LAVGSLLDGNRIGEVDGVENAGGRCGCLPRGRGEGVAKGLEDSLHVLSLNWFEFGVDIEGKWRRRVRSRWGSGGCGLGGGSGVRRLCLSSVSVDCFHPVPSMLVKKGLHSARVQTVQVKIELHVAHSPLLKISVIGTKGAVRAQSDSFSSALQLVS
jgi:hypothetical protein